MSMRLASYLKDFSTAAAPPAPSAPAFDIPSVDAFDMDFPALPEPEPVDVEAIRREAYAEGHEAGEKAVEERFEVERQAMEIAHAQALAERDQKLRDEFAEILATKLPDVIRNMSIAVSEQAAIALAPVIGEALAEKAVKDLSDLLQAAIASGEAGKIDVKGPRHLFEKLQAEMPEHTSFLRHTEDDDLDLTAEFGDAALVTRISAFTASLKKVLA
ncbi:FliH/SctL family protein [Rhizobium rhizophilum]|uniref:GTPase n=1 Tax=Rhizobium rhizophilum TaxID=1850373 RepID=A0ABY2R1B4_9HYPH|nr:GTPase [Rhizobium rhizophilum]THV16969.1 GTPase [Rhizobium rhizophilum]